MRKKTHLHKGILSLFIGKNILRNFVAMLTKDFDGIRGRFFLENGTALGSLEENPGQCRKGLTLKR